jgi:hypothetical protein
MRAQGPLAGGDRCRFLSTQMKMIPRRGFAFPISWDYNGRGSCANVCASFCAALRKERVPAAEVRVSSYWRPSPGEPPEGQGRALSAVVLRASEVGEEE